MKKQILTLALTLAAALGGTSLAAGAGAGSTISNVGVFETTDAGGTTANTPSNAVDLTVTQIAALTVGADGTVANPGETVNATPGQNAVLTYTVTNTGNGSDTLNLRTVDGNGNPITTTLYRESDGVPGLSAGDTPITSVNLAADESATVYAVYAVPANAPANTNVYVNLIGTTTVTNTGTPATDANNVHLASAVTVVNFTIDGTKNANITTPGVVSLTHLLTNTGNGTLDPATLNGTSTINDPAAVLASVRYVVSYNGVSTPANASFQAALQAAPALPAGESYTITTTYTSNAGKLAGDQATNALSVYDTATDSATLSNRVPAAQAVNTSDTLTVIKGAAAVTKVAVTCADAACTAPVSNPSSAKPGEYIRYTVEVRNTGNAGLPYATLRDYTPRNTSFVSVTGSSSQTGAVLFSTDRATWNTAAPTTLSENIFSSGPFAYVGLDSNNDGTVNSADTLAPGATLTLVITVKVRDTGVSNPVPVSPI